MIKNKFSNFESVDVEEWKEYIFKENDTNFRLEISNHGRIKTFTKLNPEGKLINGTKAQGYPYVRVTFYKGMDEKYKEKMQPLLQEIENVTLAIKELRQSTSAKNQTIKFQTELDSLLTKKAKLSERRKKFTNKYTRKSYTQVGLLIHKGVAELFLPQPSSEKKFVIHLDWNKENNHFSNLAWASQEEVTQHQFSNPQIELQKFKLQLLGEKKKPNTNMSKLTENEVLLIKRKLKKGDSMRSLAKRFGVSDMQIHRIKTGENWSHLKEVSELLEEQKK